MQFSKNFKTKFMTVTPLSKNIALALVALLPFLGFICGYKYNASITSIPLTKCSTLTKDQPEPTSGRIISSAYLSGCDIYINTNKEKDLKIGKLNGTGNPTQECISGEGVKLEISPSRKYLVFEDISGGIDSMLRVYSLERNEINQLHVYGTSAIYEYVFMPGDLLVALHGYPGIVREHWVTAFDIPSLHRDYKTTLNEEYSYFTFGLNDGIYFKGIPLDYFDIDYTDLKISSESIYVLTEDPDKFTIVTPQDYTF